MSGITFVRSPELPFLELKQCDSLNQLSYKKHFHEELSIGLVEEGSTRVWSEGQQFQASAGQVVCFPPLVPHACHPDNPSIWKYTMIFIHPEWFAGVPCDLKIHRPHFPVLLQGARGNRCRQLILACRSLLREDASPLEIESMLLELMHLTEVVVQPSPPVPDMDRAAPAVLQVKSYLDLHYKERITLDTLQEISGVSKFHLIRLFNATFHLAPHAYQNLLRINYAKRELLNGRPIADVAFDAGFYDQSHFTRTFSGCVGTTPLQYIRAASS